jgi:hypothetical protein
VKKYLWRGVEIYSKHIEIFESILTQDHLPQPKLEESEITHSTIAPFSDLMMFLKSIFGATTIGFYGTAIGTCQRIDLATNFSSINSG